MIEDNKNKCAKLEEDMTIMQAELIKGEFLLGFLLLGVDRWSEPLLSFFRSQSAFPARVPQF